MAVTGRPAAFASDGEMSLVVLARHESELHIRAAEARRRTHTVGVLITVAALVFCYDVLSVVLSR